MKKALLKDTLREIKKSFGRFISIFMIVGIGVAFFAGVKDSVLVMKNTADGYFDEYNFMDMKIMSTMGLTNDDVNALKKTEGVLGVYGSHSMDVLNTKNNLQRVFKLMSYPMNDTQKDKNYINQLKVINGRLPEKENECVVEYAKIGGSISRIGEELTFSSGTDSDIESSIKNTTYTVVGEVTMPYYLSFEKGSASIGSGKINSFAIIPDTNFKQDYYSEAYVTLKDTKAVNTYGDKYFDIVEPIKDKVTSLGKQQATLRYEDIKAEAMKKIQDGQNEYDKNKKIFDDKIQEAKATLSQSEIDLNNAQTTLNNEKAKTLATISTKEAELNNALQKLAELQNTYATQKPIYDQGKAEFEAKSQQAQTQIVQIQQKIVTLHSEIAKIDAALQQPGLSPELKQQYLNAKAKLEEGLNQANAGLATIQMQLKAGQAELDKGKQGLNQLSAGIATIQKETSGGKEQIAQGREQANTQFAQAQTKIDNGRTELEKGKDTLAKEEKDGAVKLLEAKEKIDQGLEDVNAIKEPSWYVLDRHSHYSYMDYGSAADRMGAIAEVFPLFFFLVAALVCLTTMTRMVDEQRQEIGTLKALGYSKRSIVMKYVAYAGIASVFGGFFGAWIGMIIFPTVIFNAWGIMYSLPEVRLQPDLPLALLAVGLSSLITIIAAIFACYKDLIETPALLMRPKAPKNGKKILLERIPFIWKHFNFIHKVTARNIFRYKKRFLMTVIGISGCTALLVAGFGIRDSIGEIASKQYGEIYKFDVSMAYKDKSKASQQEDVLASLSKEKNVESALEMTTYHGLYADKGEDKGVDLYVSKDMKDFNKYITLRTRLGHKELSLTNDGVIITEKLATLKKLSIGDTFAVDDGEGTKKDLKINGICENYVGHAIYMTEDYYKDIYHRTPLPTIIFADLKDTSKELESQLGSTYMKKEAIESVAFYSSISNNFQSTISSLSIVVVVLIISAGLLAFVVLYNLTNVNISERLREIATIKVLGFYDKEVSSYVYRENIFLTLIGALVGLLLGIGLHGLIMSIAELESVMFGRNINFISFVYSFLITVGFAIIVNFVMYNKLKKIPMVESLKSVE